MSVVLAGATLTGAFAASAAAGAARPLQTAAAKSGLARTFRSLGGVSCTGRSFCMGVGPYGDQVGVTYPLSQIWNGRTWRAISVPAPNLSYHLSGVSCTSNRYCVAVGAKDFKPGAEGTSELSDAWNGRSWQILPVLGGLGRSALNGVACPVDGQCIAVGAAKGSLLAQSLNGKTWSLTAPPVIPAGAVISSFAGISCAGPSDCMAVGSYYTTPSQLTGYALAEDWNGHAWTLLTPPADMEALSGVSCPAATVCVVVGAAPPHGSGIGSAVWDGTSWTRLSTPSPGKNKYEQSLNGVSCPSPAYCIAVGSGPGPYYGTGGVHAFAERWTGGPGWHLLRVPDPSAIDFAGDTSYLKPPPGFASVSCTGPARCLAVGGDGASQALSSYVSFAEAWNGTSWRVLRTGKVDGLLAVSCAARSGCLTAGTYLSAGDATNALAEYWTGTRMRLVSPRGLHGARGELMAVSCPSAFFCMAAAGLSAIAIWNGRKWAWSGIRANSHPPTNVYELTCTSRKFCMALGTKGIFNGDVTTQVKIWNGRKWRVAPPFAGPVSGVFDDLSCLKPTFCMAVGFWANDNGQGGTLVDAWNGRKWLRIRSPGQSQANALATVSCVTTTDCVAIDVKQPSGTETSYLIAERWHGRRHWTSARLPGRLGLVFDFTRRQFRLDISCESRTRCVVAGSYSVSGSPRSLANVGLSWNGHIWRRTKVPGQGGLSALSCASASRCVAIGLPGLRTLADLWNGRSWKVIRTINP